MICVANPAKGGLHIITAVKSPGVDKANGFTDKKRPQSVDKRLIT